MRFIWLFSCLFFSITAFGQYFGRNKVQYETFDYKILKTKHFDIYYYEQSEPTIQDIGQMAEVWYDRLSDIFDHQLLSRNPIVIYASHTDFQQTTITSGLIGEGTGGFTEGLRNRVVLPLTESYASTNHVLGHELVHAFQYDILRARDSVNIRSSMNVPLWFIEGLAEYLSIGTYEPHTSMWLRDGIIHDDIPTLREMSRDFSYFPYRYGHAFWTYITGKWGDDVIARLYFETAKYGYEEALFRLTGMREKKFSKEWQQSIKDFYAGETTKGSIIDKKGTKLIGDKRGGKMNLAPSVSPDGRYLVFLTEREVFTMDLFLADAQTGRILKKIASSGSSTHLNAMMFLESAGTWSPDSRQLAYVVFRGGVNELVIMDVERRNVTDRIKFPEMGSILNPSWSPDGRYIAFSGMNGGITDLYLYDLTEKKVRQLTSDKYTDLQASWSPDSRRIAFVTDRGAGTDLERYLFSPLKLAIYNVENSELDVLNIFSNAKHINPHFSRDGYGLYFISDVSGVSNIYFYDLTNGTIRKNSEVLTGVTGITQSSPALSYAVQADVMVYSVFEEKGYNIYRMENADAASRDTIDVNSVRPAIGQMPPGDRQPRQLVNSYIVSGARSVPDTASFREAEYKPKLRLEQLSNVGVGVGSSRFGGIAVGGANLWFTDMMNEHVLITAIQATGTLKDLGGIAAYYNQRKRFVWGGTIGHLPYASVRVAAGIDTVNYQPNNALILQQQIIRTFDDQVSIQGFYPFTREHRAEVSLGYSHISYDVEILESVIIGNLIVREELFSVDAPPPLNLVMFSSAFVGDRSFFGFTSPLKGRRYRLEAGTTFGSLNFLTFLADVRQYFRASPVTFAFRGMHYGRYFKDAEDTRLFPLYVGYDHLVRGYNFSSFTGDECSGPDCPELNRLIGSKIAVGNFEVRLPLLGHERLSLIRSRVLPVDFNLFADGGVAWRDAESPVWDFVTTSTERIPVFSAGASFRINLFGYIIGEIYYAYPFQRQLRQDGVFGLSLSPGW
jgi:Tol biopolymer transport system component